MKARLKRNLKKAVNIIIFKNIFLANIDYILNEDLKEELLPQLPTKSAETDETISSVKNDVFDEFVIEKTVDGFVFNI